jgi:hypothetical protein
MDRNPMIKRRSCCLHQPEKFSQNFPQGASDSEGGEILEIRTRDRREKRGGG